MSAGLRAEGLGFAWNGLLAFSGIDLEVGPGSLVAVLGPSGCGKSTLLRVLAGLLPVGEGRVERPRREGDRAGVAMAFQDPRLLPWMSVRENLHFALECAGVPAAERDGRVLPLLARVGLDGVLERRPAELSGGMAQRVGLVRALSLRPRLLLLDEPFGAVDPLLRERLQADLQALLAEVDLAAVLVTHDVAEAVVLGDEVLVLSPRPGRVLQRLSVGLPRPRPPAVRLDPAFVAVEARVRAALAPPTAG